MFPRRVAQDISRQSFRAAWNFGRARRDRGQKESRCGKSFLSASRSKLIMTSVQVADSKTFSIYVSPAINIAIYIQEIHRTIVIPRVGWRWKGSGVHPKPLKGVLGHKRLLQIYPPRFTSNDCDITSDNYGIISDKFRIILHGNQSTGEREKGRERYYPTYNSSRNL